MRPDMQAKVLRVLDEQRFRRVGGVNEIGVDVQILAASNRDLPTMMGRGEFREDLYYRLKVVDLHLPPLRERIADIPALVGNVRPPGQPAHRQQHLGDHPAGDRRPQGSSAGPATSASCATPSNAPCSSATTRSSTSGTCHPSSRPWRSSPGSLARSLHLRLQTLDLEAEMIPLTMRDTQILIAGAVFVLGCMCILLGAFVLISRGYSKEIKALAAHTARLGQKGLAEEVSGLVNSASTLVAALSELVRSANGVGLFLMTLGLMMLGAAYWIITEIHWPA